MKCSGSNCSEYISHDNLILSAIIMVHWTSSININNHNKIVSVHKYHLGPQTWIFQVTEISFSHNPKIYYENKKHENTFIVDIHSD